MPLQKQGDTLGSQEGKRTVHLNVTLIKVACLFLGLSIRTTLCSTWMLSLATSPLPEANMSSNWNELGCQGGMDTERECV